MGAVVGFRHVAEAILCLCGPISQWRTYRLKNMGACVGAKHGDPSCHRLQTDLEERLATTERRPSTIAMRSGWAAECRMRHENAEVLWGMVGR